MKSFRENPDGEENHGDYVSSRDIRQNEKDMTNTAALLDRIELLAGSQRDKTFRAAAEFALAHKLRWFIETGCYRGNPADGLSTLILAELAAANSGRLYSVDINADSIRQAKTMLAINGAGSHPVIFYKSDSVLFLSSWRLSVQFAYIDSYDHEPANPGPCQRHQLAEIGALLGKILFPPCAILLDDNIPETGGKTLLSAAFLKDRGWKLAAESYQLLFVRE